MHTLHIMAVIAAENPFNGLVRLLNDLKGFALTLAFALGTLALVAAAVLWVPNPRTARNLLGGGVITIVLAAVAGPLAPWIESYFPH